MHVCNDIGVLLTLKCLFDSWCVSGYTMLIIHHWVLEPNKNCFYFLRFLNKSVTIIIKAYFRQNLALIGYKDWMCKLYKGVCHLLMQLYDIMYRVWRINLLEFARNRRRMDFVYIKLHTSGGIEVKQGLNTICSLEEFCSLQHWR